MRKVAAIRLEGGIGDHILGLRLLPFVRKAYPGHRLVVYSDAAGHPNPLAVARLSPYVDEALPVFHKKGQPTLETWGSLENIRTQDLRRMKDADVFFDTWKGGLFVEAARHLGVPLLEILRTKPVLRLPFVLRRRVEKFLGMDKGHIFIGLCVAKHQLAYLKKYRQTVLSFLKPLLADPRVVILNFYTTQYQFPHWPQEVRRHRQIAAELEGSAIGTLWNIHPRVVPVVDAPLEVVAGCLKKCAYFFGVDDGIKHLAWALGVPYDFFIHEIPGFVLAMTCMPDVHQALLFDASRSEITKRVAQVRGFIFKQAPGGGSPKAT
jgi:hypothetical protein